VSGNDDYGSGYGRAVEDVLSIFEISGTLHPRPPDGGDQVKAIQLAIERLRDSNLRYMEEKRSAADGHR